MNSQPAGVALIPAACEPWVAATAATTSMAVSSPSRAIVQAASGPRPERAPGERNPVQGLGR